MVNVRDLWNFHENQKLQNQDAPLQYRSISDTARLITNKLEIFSNYDLVVGIPRSGLIPASIISLSLNIPLITINEFLISGKARSWSRRGYSCSSVARKKVLVVDDSINTGSALNSVRESLRGVQLDVEKISFLAVYATKFGSTQVNYFLEQIEHPRVFEWNILHHGYSNKYLFDLDGIMCKDGPPEFSNDGGKYLSYIEGAPIKIRPTGEVGAIVTSRLSKYRKSTELWLKKNDIRYRHLIMLDLESAEERRSLAIHAKFKADVYIALGGMLFIESEEWQAKAISEIANKPVFCLATGLMYNLGHLQKPVDGRPMRSA